VCCSESLLVLTSERPLQHTASNSSSSTIAGHNSSTKGQQQQESLHSLLNRAASLTTRSLTTADAAATEGDMSMDGVDWVDVEGRGPFYCPAPRAGSGRRVSAALQLSIATCSGSH
jgi:hypothetical protein